MTRYLARLVIRSMALRSTNVVSNTPPSFPPRLGRHDGLELSAQVPAGAPAQSQFPAREPGSAAALLVDPPPGRVARADPPTGPPKDSVESHPGNDEWGDASAASSLSADLTPPEGRERGSAAEPTPSLLAAAAPIRVEPVQAVLPAEPALRPSGTAVRHTPTAPDWSRNTASDSDGASPPPAPVPPVSSAPGVRVNGTAGPTLAASSSSQPPHAGARNVSAPGLDHPGATGRMIVPAIPDPRPVSAPPTPLTPSAAVLPAAEPAPIDVHIGTIEIVAEPAPPVPAARPRRQRAGLDAYARLRGYDWDDWHE